MCGQGGRGDVSISPVFDFLLLLYSFFFHFSLLLLLLKLLFSTYFIDV